MFGVLLVAIGALLVANPLGSLTSERTNGALTFARARVGANGSAYIAVFSSLLGIGGGIIHVPFLIRISSQWCCWRRRWRSAGKCSSPIR